MGRDVDPGQRRGEVTLQAVAFKLSPALSSIAAETAVTVQVCFTQCAGTDFGSGERRQQRAGHAADRHARQLRRHIRNEPGIQRSNRSQAPLRCPAP